MTPAAGRSSQVFGAVLLGRLLYPFFNSPLQHLFSDPLRHWQTGRDFLHPDVMGGGDPFAYQLWLFLIRSIADGSEAFVLTATGVLCAAMPYGWYRALRELRPREHALRGAIILGLIPGFLGIYGYFMTETLLLSLTGFAFWMTLRAHRKSSIAAFAAATAFWLVVCHTRIVLLPMAGICLSWLWWLQPQKSAKLFAGLALATAITVPAGLHARAALGYFAPFGNLYLNEIYHDSGAKEITIDYGPQGRYVFGSPSYYNPTFLPWSDWLTSRRGTVAIAIDTHDGRAAWQRERRRTRTLRTTSALADRWENLLYLLFAQQWPDNDRGTLIGTMTVASRWFWLPALAAVGFFAARRRYRGNEWLLPVCGLTTVCLLAVQSEGIMEGRFRKPVEPVVIAALFLALQRRPATA